MTLRKQVAEPSTLADVIWQVRDAFDAMGNATPIMVGRQHLKPGPGSAPRVVFVPETGGVVGRPLELGNAASISHGCEVYVKSRESGDDIKRFVNVYELAKLVIDCIQTAATSKIDWGRFDDGSPTDTDGPGCEIAFSFTYTNDVWHNARRWALPPAADDTADRVPHPPPGTLAGGVEIDVTTVPQDLGNEDE